MTMQQHQLNIPSHLQQQNPSASPAQAQIVAESGQIINKQPTPQSSGVAATQRQKKTPSPNKGDRNNHSIAAINRPHHVNNNVYPNAYSKKSTTDLIRNKLSAQKKKNGNFSHSDEMQYKRTTQLRDFVIMQKLGDGAYSCVYKVKRIEDGQIYALKKVKIGAQSMKDKENAINEVRILSSINHPNVVPYKEAFIDNDSQSLNLVMQLADGGDLLKMITDRKKRKVHFRESQVWRVLIETVYGLRAMHELRVMHRDIKSANIFLYRNFEGQQVDGGNLYQAKLGDMNVSKVTNQSGLNYTQTGTPYYASPEVWKDEPYGYKSDIWSLGCVIYEMLALKPPFSGRDMDHLYKRVCKGIYPRIPDHYSNDIWAIVQLMLRVNSNDRPDCAQLIQSKMFKIYTDKLNSLESVDFTFQNTLKSASPDRARATNITNSLLTQLHLPQNDLGRLASMLPMRNYNSTLTEKDVKANSSQIDETHQLSATSRKLQSIRNVHPKDQSRHENLLKARTVEYPAEEVPTTAQLPSQQHQILQLNIQESTSTPRKNNKNSKKAPSTISPKMTKIQSKLQRQYLQQNSQTIVSQENSSILPNTAEHASNANNRSSNNPTPVVDDRSGSKQQSLLLKQHDVVSTDGKNQDHRDNTLRNRLHNKRSQIQQQQSGKEDNAADKDNQMQAEMHDGITKQKSSTNKKQKGNISARLLTNDSQVSQANDALNFSPLKPAEGGMAVYDQTSSQTPNIIGHHNSKGGVSRPSRISLPLVSMANKSVEKHFVTQKSGSIQPGAMISTDHQQTPQTQLPLLSERDSENAYNHHLVEIGTATTIKDTAASGASTRLMPSAVQSSNQHVMKSERGKLAERFAAAAHQSNITPDINQQNAKIGKRHASFDVLLPATAIVGGKVFQAKQSVPNVNVPQTMIASQGALLQANSDVNIMAGGKSNRLPESQSYSQINMINMQGGLNSIVNHHLGSSSSISDEQRLHQEKNNHVLMKQSIRKRYNQVNVQNHLSLSKENSSSHHQLLQHQFSNNQQQSVRHEQSNANFSLNSEELRHAGFQHQHNNVGGHHHHQTPVSGVGLISEESSKNSSRRHKESHKNIRLPKIDKRKKSTEMSVDSEYRKINPNSLKHHSVITKKKPSHGNHSHISLQQQQQQHYHSMVNNGQQLSQKMQMNLASTPRNNNNTHSSTQISAHQNQLQIKNDSNSSIQPQISQQIASRLAGGAQAIPGIKKKTLAAYSNSTRAPRLTNRQNLAALYTQKQNS